MEMKKDDDLEFFKNKKYKGFIHVYFKNSQTLTVDPSEVVSARRLATGNIELVTGGEEIEYDPCFVGFIVKAMVPLQTEGDDKK